MMTIYAWLGQSEEGIDDYFVVATSIEQAKQMLRERLDDYYNYDAYGVGDSVTRVEEARFWLVTPLQHVPGKRPPIGVCEWDQDEHQPPLIPIRGELLTDPLSLVALAVKLGAWYPHSDDASE